jgi:hypothetical protein
VHRLMQVKIRQIPNGGHDKFPCARIALERLQSYYEQA